MTPTQLIPARSTARSTRTTRAVHPVPAPLRALAALALATGVALLTGAPASAHDSIVGTSPEDGAVLDAAPASVAVTLSDVPQAIAPRIIVTNSAGATMLDEEPVITDRSASVELPALENDTYQVAWRVVSSDGHPIQGTYSFTVAAQVAEEPATDPAATPASDEPAVGETASSTAAADPTSTASTSTAAETTAADEGSSSTALVAGAIVAVLAVALAGLVLVRRRSSLKDES